MNKAALSTKPSLAVHDLVLRLIAVPLYESVELSTYGTDPLLLRLYGGKFDARCPNCEKGTTWKFVVPDGLMRQAQLQAAASVNVSMAASRNSTPSDREREFKLSIVCARHESHIAHFYFTTIPAAAGGGTALIKIGQYPSLTDFQIGELADFEEGMSKTERREFIRATNCTAHGFNVAACVYFRRIFESVLKEGRSGYMLQHSLTEWLEFDSARTDERIKLLRDHLPNFLTDHPQLYGLLSLGVHELSEEECAVELPMLRNAIELIFRDRVTAARHRRERQEVSKLVAQAVNRHKP